MSEYLFSFLWPCGLSSVELQCIGLQYNAIQCIGLQYNAIQCIGLNVDDIHWLVLYTMLSNDGFDNNEYTCYHWLQNRFLFTMNTLKTPVFNDYKISFWLQWKQKGSIWDPVFFTVIIQNICIMLWTKKGSIHNFSNVFKWKDLTKSDFVWYFRIQKI